MNRSIVRASAVLLCLSAPTFADEAPSAPATETHAVAKTTEVPEVAIESFAHLPQCRRYVPTGSRIAKERCDTPSSAAGEHAAARREFDSLRQQQMMEEQARQQARAAALRRRMGY